MKIYNKLVRDKIPEVIEASGKKYEIRIAEREEKKEERGGFKEGIVLEKTY